ncbi:MAG: STAS domain-containing protein [Firmicutes bacterium]|nr:STAS domain-containing protein [Bacillota bacterium]
MNIEKIINANELTLILDGRLDTATSPKLEEELKAVLGNLKKLVLDFTNLEYISSAGLRVLLMAQKAMSKQGEMIILNVNETVMEVFEITGFADMLTIQ